MFCLMESRGRFLLDDFLAHVRVERGLSENTAEAYRRDLEQLAAHLGDLFGRPDEVTVADLRDFLRAQARRGLAMTSLSRKVASIRSFFVFLRREGHVERNPAASLRGGGKRRRLPNVLSRAEVERLLAAPDPETPLGLRDRALFELLYSCGLRVSEALGLTPDDLSMEGRYVRVVGKGSKERVVPFGDQAASTLDAYLARGRPVLAARGKPRREIFLNRSGGALSRVGCFKVLRGHWRTAGGVRPVSPHVLRHTFATHLIENGADVRFVQELLGHADVSTTVIYTHVSRERLRREFLRYHPRESGREH